MPDKTPDAMTDDELVKELREVADYVLADGYEHSARCAREAARRIEALGAENAKLKAGVTQPASDSILTHCQNCGQFRGHGHECSEAALAAKEGRQSPTLGSEPEPEQTR